MRFDDICEKIAAKELGKPGMMVEAMVNRFYLKKGNTFKVERGDFDAIKLDNEYWYFPRFFRKALEQ